MRFSRIAGSRPSACERQDQMPDEAEQAIRRKARRDLVIEIVCWSLLVALIGACVSVDFGRYPRIEQALCRGMGHFDVPTRPQ